VFVILGKRKEVSQLKREVRCARKEFSSIQRFNTVHRFVI
jgi:hypothetical protein